MGNNIGLINTATDLSGRGVKCVSKYAQFLVIEGPGVCCVACVDGFLCTERIIVLIHVLSTRPDPNSPRHSEIQFTQTLL